MQSRETNHISSVIHLVKIFIFAISCSTTISIELSKNYGGFSTELIHSNSPLSPFFNPNLTHQRLLGQTRQIGSSPLILDNFHYLMKISYGKPPIEFYHIIDTGSEISWIQCLPCIHCYPSESSPFPPKISRTFKFENCSSQTPCPYKVNYGDKSSTNGDLARETITTGSGSQKIEFENFLFGCGHDNRGNYPHKAAGLVGFNLQPRSFISQLRTKHHGAFSYCMAPPGSQHAGKISFGREALVLSSGNNVMTAPLILDSHYNVMLTGISIGRQKLIKYFPDSYNSPPSSSPNRQLKLTIDSGSNSIYISNSFYAEVEKTIRKRIKHHSPITVPGGYKLCYSPSLRDAEIRKIKVHFPGVVLELSPYKTFVTGSTFRCLAILPRNDTHVLGSMAQINFWVGFDLVEKKLSFKPTDCSAL